MLFVYDAFVKSGESVSVTQRLFRRHFNIGRHGAVPSRNTILLWVNNFRALTHKSRTLNDLKEAIGQEIRPIDRQLLARVMDDLKKKRLENCIQEDGRHLTDVIFKT